MTPARFPRHGNFFPRHGKRSPNFSTPWKTIPPRLLLPLLLVSCTPAPPDATLSGRTMGTTYSIRIAAPPPPRALRVLHAEIDAILEDLNRQMSVWRTDSEISRYNRAAPGEAVAVSPDFLHVLRRSLEIAEAADGAFDPTVGALVGLWGFGPEGPPLRKPAPEEIAAARATTGWRHVSIAPDGRIAKAVPGLRLDLGAAAKGHGVDRIAQLLRARGLENFLVEIGGETLAEGLNPDRQPWRVGLLRPDPNPAAGGAIHAVLHLTGGRALATSGDYRNFYRDADGTLQPHVVDPRAAAPVRHGVASVTVLAADCLSADALATALMVLGPAEGFPLLAAAPGAEALFLLRRPDGGFDEASSPGFADAIR